jgi:hypothetical protein
MQQHSIIYFGTLCSNFRDDAVDGSTNVEASGHRLQSDANLVTVAWSRVENSSDPHLLVLCIFRPASEKAVHNLFSRTLR